MNELDKNRAEWLGEFATYTANLAMADGFNWAALGWSSGETGQGERLSHIYLTAGEHLVHCTALDGKGGAGETTRTLSVDPPFGWQDNLVSNGDFAAGLGGWSTWVERGTLLPVVGNGGCRLQSDNHNGGIYQTFSTKSHPGSQKRQSGRRPHRHSVLAFSGVAPEGDALRLQWHGGIAARQVLEVCPGLGASASSWSPLLTNHPPTSISNSAVLPRNGPSALWRLRAVRP